MDRVLKVITLEIKKRNFIKGVIISILTLIPFLLLIVIADRTIDISYALIKIIPFIFLASFCFSLNQEFSNKTDKIIFTGIFKRHEIIISKLISLCFQSIIYFIFYEIVSILYNGYIGKDILQFLNVKIVGNNLYVFLIYAFTLSSFILLVSACTTNSILTGIITYILYFDLILVIFANVLESKGNEVLKIIIRNLPFYSANVGFFDLEYTLNQSIVMVVSGCIFLVIGFSIINKKNI